MTPQRFAAAYVATAAAFLTLDSIWLTVMADRLYRPALGPLLLDPFDPAPAAIFYALYLAGIVVFAVAPALASRRALKALVLGALFGVVAYATYDLTNQATLRGWPWRVTLADLAWGSFATGTAACAGGWVTMRLTRPRR